METHKPPFHLKEIKLEVTHNCLLRCVHCSSMSESETYRQMSFEKCHEIISEAATMGVKEIAFSGGEPLLWDGLVRAVEFASHSGMDVSLYTTGNVERGTTLLERLKVAGLSHVMFSLFSAEETNHERITKVKGSFETTLAAVKTCVDLGFDVEFHFVPLSHNYKELRAISEMAKDRGVNRVSVLRLVPQGRGAEDTVKALDTSENKSLRQMIITLRQEGHEIRTGSPFNALMLRDKPQCCSGVDRLTVSPDLKLFPCDAFKQITNQMIGVGKDYSCLDKSSLTDCWEKSPYLKKIRDYLTTPFADKCGECSALEKCLSGCVAQKFHTYGKLLKCPDPMCLLPRQMQSTP